MLAGWAASPGPDGHSCMSAGTRRNRETRKGFFLGNHSLTKEASLGTFGQDFVDEGK